MATPRQRVNNLLDEPTGWIVLYSTGHRQWLTIDENQTAHMNRDDVNPCRLEVAMMIAREFHGYVADLDNITIRLYNVVSGEHIPYSAIVVD